MRTFLLTITFSFIAAVGLGQHPANAGTIPLVTLTTGNEVIEDFSSQTPEYEFQAGFANPLVIFDMAFGGSDQYMVQFAPGPNTILGNLPGSLTEQGPISTYIAGELAFNAGYYSGSLDIFVTDESATANDPLAGFEISNSAISLDIPTATPIPGALPLFAAGLGCLGFLGWRRKPKNAGALASLIEGQLLWGRQ